MAFNDKLGTAHLEIRASLEKFKRDLNSATNSVKMAGNRMKATMATTGRSMAASLQQARFGILAVGAAVAGVGTSVVRATASVQTMTVALESMLGSTSAANKLVDELKQFSAKTPFQLENIAAATKQLLAAGVQADQIVARLKVLGDIAAGANIPLADMASIFAKIQNKGKAMTEELLQLSDRGIPIIRELAEVMGVAESAVFELASQGKITADIMDEAFKRMTSKGGIFADQMIKQSGTLAGKFSTLTDNVNLLAAEIGDTLTPAMDGALDSMIDMTQGMTNFIKKGKEANSTYQSLGTILGGLALGPGIAGGSLP
jgi:tape measure domain-containing protein